MTKEFAVVLKDLKCLKCGEDQEDMSFPRGLRNVGGFQMTCLECRATSVYSLKNSVLNLKKSFYDSLKDD